MDIRAAEISSILKKQIKDFGKDADVAEIGTDRKSTRLNSSHRH